MIRKKREWYFVLLIILGSMDLTVKAKQNTFKKPNIVLIYADDLGYGDVSCYGATKIYTPNIDKIAARGLRFTNAHCSSATCTPSRYSLLTGQYAWRKQGTGILSGEAALVINVDRLTLPSMLQEAGYTSGIVGKWHLGLGLKKGEQDWNGEIKPGPLEIGFDYSYIIPVTGDRVPCVFIEGHRVVNLDPKDSLKVSFSQQIGNDPTGKEHPELLKMMYSSEQMSNTIVNGISRIGFMSGGHSARWVDENIADTLACKAKEFITGNKARSFFLYLATHDIHGPRVPNSRFVGKSGLGARGDAILQLDWTVGEVLNTLDSLGLSQNTLVIFTSDNGPALDAGYKDEAVEKLNGHKPSGPLRGGKFSKFDAGTRIPMLIKWPGKINPCTSDALISQVDFLASLAILTGQKLKAGDAPDSSPMLETLLGKSKTGRKSLVEQGQGLALIKGKWKYIEPSDGPAIMLSKNIELGNNPAPQLYNLKNDIGERNNIATKYPTIVKEMAKLLESIKHENSINKKLVKQ